MLGAWYHDVGNAFAGEFADLGDAGQVTQVVVRLLLAGILGGVLGYQREAVGKSAGLRTHMLVAIGAALFVLVPKQAGVSDADLARVIQGLVAGIGFLGAGAIVKGNGDDQIKGMTTAANIWMTAAIGVAVGLGREMTAVLSTLLALGVLTLLVPVSKWIEPEAKDKK